MKEFNTQQFMNDLVSLRGTESQVDFAKKIGVNRSTLSLLENGKQLPTLKVLSTICDMSGKLVDDYFHDSMTDGLVFLMGNLDEHDKDSVSEMLERIRIREKYEELAKRARA